MLDGKVGSAGVLSRVWETGQKIFVGGDVELTVEAERWLLQFAFSSLNPTKGKKKGNVSTSLCVCMGCTLVLTTFLPNLCSSTALDAL